MADEIKTQETVGQEPFYAVTSVTEAVPHEADASSAPGPYTDLSVNRPPVSTNEPQTPIAHSLVAGAGAPQPPDGPLPEDWEPDGQGGARVKDDAQQQTPAATQQSAGGERDLESMNKAEMLEYARSLGVTPANNDMTKEELRAGVDARLAAGS